MAIEIRRVRPGDGPALRSARVQALTDMPLAFGVTLEATLERTPEEWAERVNNTSEGDKEAMFLALDGDQPVGLMGSYFEPEDDCWVLISVWVHADHRGTSLATDLHTVVTDWVRSTGATEIFLDVWDGNPRALGFYQRLGYVLTGSSHPHHLDPTETELDMRLQLQA